MPKDTREFLRENAEKCDSRSLFFDRFADPESTDSGVESPRRDWFVSIAKRRPETFRLQAWTQFLESFEPSAESVLYAQLQSRLIVNMAGGVMENAGLCLDRFGMPYIPGAAVKGCARRVALAALREWCHEGRKPGCSANDEDNVLKPACDPFTEQVEMVSAIARIFGWVETDWRSDFKSPNDDEWGRSRSDLAWACGESTWNFMRLLASQQLGTRTGSPNGSPPPVSQPTPGACSAQIAFLPALPIDLVSSPGEAGILLPIPQPGDLELDVVTCHHRAYYSGQLAAATDTEEPNPVVFLTVAPGHVFGFKMAALRGATPADLAIARTWLACGLSTMGLGAKTHAGYGWFDTRPQVAEAVQLLRESARQQARDAKRLLHEEQTRKREEAERRRKAEERKIATAHLTPEQRIDYDWAQLTDDQFQGRLESFAKRDIESQHAIVRALRMDTEAAGSRHRLWSTLKTKAQKGGKPAQIADAIRQISKELFPGKNWRMP